MVQRDTKNMTDEALGRVFTRRRVAHTRAYAWRQWRRERFERCVVIRWRRRGCARRWLVDSFVCSFIFRLLVKLLTKD